MINYCLPYLVMMQVIFNQDFLFPDYKLSAIYHIKNSLYLIQVSFDYTGSVRYGGRQLHGEALPHHAQYLL